MNPSLQPLLALIDGNNFFCSCERVFNPKLRNVPLVVLSNNDGCVISRSEEAKAVGIPMGAPFFKIRDLVLRHQIRIHSSNFALYADMSDRLMQTLERWALKMEVYSVDEAFLWMPSLPDPHAWALKIRQNILQETGLPVSVGVATTKVLAKLSNQLAKKREHAQGVWVWSESSETQTLLETLECEKIWGIGRESARHLTNAGIHSISDFRKSERSWIRQNLSVTGERLWMELHGIPTLQLEENPAAQKSILCSRSFGKEVTSLEELREAISTHLSSASEKLRGQKTLAGSLTIFLKGDRFKTRAFPHRAHASHRLSSPTDYAPTLIQYGLKLLENIFDPTRKYQKSGIYLTDLQSPELLQPDWFEERVPREKQQRLMETMDRINHRWGSEKVHLGSSGFAHAWAGKSRQRSPQYTTSWRELPVAS